MVAISMKTYARIQDGFVAELVRTNGDIAAMFNSGLVWSDVSAHPEVATGWQFDGTNFSAPAAPPQVPPAPTLAELQAQLAALSAQLASLSTKN